MGINFKQGTYKELLTSLYISTKHNPTYSVHY